MTNATASTAAMEAPTTAKKRLLRPEGSTKTGLSGVETWLCAA
jgi:hypothetical protein